ncbi:hypothetical protein TrLO_g8146 [Triparma laevis f. longispina]|uniref:deoxyribose-phosphate aldolase n=1 Tax=Triparma laevis f. longispina TaxID=1714387 RepID=A0A9W7CA13_9STRA|nr:hypothetical protein TrLO_g8146 [Triparma laevis f. longispina]
MSLPPIVSSVFDTLIAAELLQVTSLPVVQAPPAFPESVATLIDHTVLGTQATSTDIEKICNEAKIHSFKSVCIPPSFVSLAKSLLSDSKPLVCTVVSFPNGYCTSRVKAFETEQAIADGADEIDMVCSVPLLNSLSSSLSSSPSQAREYAQQYVQDILEVCDAARGVTVKCIIEIGALTEVEVVIASFLFREARHINVQQNKKSHGPHYIKTSTGFNGYGGATLSAVQIMSSIVRESGGKVKASGGVGSFEMARKIVEGGAERIGASKGVKIVEGGRGEEGGY